MTDAVLAGHFAAIDASLELLRVQMEALKHYMASKPEPSRELPAATFGEDLPERCKSIDPSRCGLQDEDARMARGTMSDPNAWQCVGCRVKCEHKAA